MEYLQWLRKTNHQLQEIKGRLQRTILQKHIGTSWPIAIKSMKTLKSCMTQWKWLTWRRRMRTIQTCCIKDYCTRTGHQDSNHKNCSRAVEWQELSKIQSRLGQMKLLSLLTMMTREISSRCSSSSREAIHSGHALTYSRDMTDSKTASKHRKTLTICWMQCHLGRKEDRRG